jgi:hypothetical protein
LAGGLAIRPTKIPPKSFGEGIVLENAISSRRASAFEKYLPENNDAANERSPASEAISEKSDLSTLREIAHLPRPQVRVVGENTLLAKTSASVSC